MAKDEPDERTTFLHEEESQGTRAGELGKYLHVNSDLYQADDVCGYFI